MQNRAHKNTHNAVYFDTELILNIKDQYTTFLSPTAWFKKRKLKGVKNLNMCK